MSILFGLLLARRFYCRSALSLSPGRTGGLLPRINAPKKSRAYVGTHGIFIIIGLSESRVNQSSTGAPTGHSSAQAPQAMQSSVILKAIVVTSLLVNLTLL